MGGDAKVGQYAVHFPEPVQPQETVEKPEVVRHERKPLISRSISRRIFILIKAKQATFIAQLP